MTDGEVIPFLKDSFVKITYEGLYLSAFMLLRIVFLVISSSFLTYTTSPIEMTAGLESIMLPLKKLNFPAHEIAMMMSIALRFIPTLIEETDKIMSAQKARGANLSEGGIIKRSKALIPILIPLFISAFRRADDLAIAMESRCYRGGENRTKLNELEFSKKDTYAIFVFVICAGIVISINYIIKV
jgi:energy-coupling factor transport system permease protein